jgi:phosphoribosylglycinamide formyltransferase-1
MNEKVKIAIFASGSGTNFQAIHEAILCGELHAEIALVVTDRPDAFIVERAKKAEVPCLALRQKDFPSKEDYEREIVAALTNLGVEWIVLAGYMRLVGTVLLSAFPSRIVNIHPSLLPSFIGKDAIGQAIAHGVKVTGVTVHFVDEGMDTGPIIAQQAVEVIEGDRASTEEAVHAVEHKIYKDTLKKLFGNK